MILAGTLTQNGTPLQAHRKPNGWGVATFAAQQTMQTVEDVGESELTAGQAFVQLDPKYTQLLNSNRTYLVFLTAQGDCRGLYVAHKNLSGFEVREMNGGRSSIAFDDRIVGQSSDASGQRLPTVSPLTTHRVRVPAFHRGLAIRPQPHRAPAVRTGYVPH